MSLEGEVVVPESESVPEVGDETPVGGPSRDDVLRMRGEVERVFYSVAAELQDLQVGDGGRTLRSRHRVNAMILHLSPVESRHEKVMRACVGMLSVLVQRQEELAGALIEAVGRLRKDAVEGVGRETAGAGEGLGPERCPAEPGGGEVVKN